MKHPVSMGVRLQNSREVQRAINTLPYSQYIRTRHSGHILPILSTSQVFTLAAGFVYYRR